MPSGPTHRATPPAPRAPRTARRRAPAGATALAALAVGACGDPQIKRLEAIRDEVCACKTSACGAAAIARVPAAQIAATPRTQRVARAMLDCLARLGEAERPDDDPDAPASSADPAAPPVDAAAPR